mmetsp:Transcript_57629/g.153998  ORF Transcript_57629/g.153998 Transcript_57629/m.153998 type:complete len:205 (-) Transcript_57629:138-752(-)
MTSPNKTRAHINDLTESMIMNANWLSLLKNRNTLTTRTILNILMVLKPAPAPMVEAAPLPSAKDTPSKTDIATRTKSNQFQFLLSERTKKCRMPSATMRSTSSMKKKQLHNNPKIWVAASSVSCVVSHWTSTPMMMELVMIMQAQAKSNEKWPTKRCRWVPSRFTEEPLIFFCCWCRLCVKVLRVAGGMATDTCLLRATAVACF